MQNLPLDLDLPALPSRAPRAPAEFQKIRNLRLVKDSTVGEEVALYVDTPAAAVAYLAGAFDAFPDQEQVWVILLNTKGRPIGRHLCTVGTLNSCQGKPAQIFRAAIVGAAAAIILANNHPSGDPSPSRSDETFTRLMREAARAIEIELHDHVIIGRAAADPAGLGHYSFRTAGLL